MWQDNYQAIKEEKKLYNEKINSGVSINEISNFFENSKLSVPEKYIEILKKFNGIEFNGFILYGIDAEYLTEIVFQKIYGLSELNQIWHEDERNVKYTFLGESNISIYVYIANKNIYLELDNPSGTIIQSFHKLDDMLDKFFAEAAL